MVLNYEGGAAISHCFPNPHGFAHPNGFANWIALVFAIAMINGFPFDFSQTDRVWLVLA